METKSIYFELLGTRINIEKLERDFWLEKFETLQVMLRRLRVLIQANEINDICYHRIPLKNSSKQHEYYSTTASENIFGNESSITTDEEEIINDNGTNWLLNNDYDPTIENTINSQEFDLNLLLNSISSESNFNF